MKIKQKDFKLVLSSDPNRSQGLHLSNVIRDIGLQLGYIPPQYASEDISADPLKICVGLAWEDYIVPHHHPEIMYHPGEFVVDGIAMSPDGISFVKEGILHEFKVTWKSMSKFETDPELSWLWMSQMKGYCRALEIVRAMLHVLWINGDYKYGTVGGAAQYKIYDIEFTPREIKENWHTITSHRNTMRKYEANEKAPVASRRHR